MISKHLRCFALLAIFALSLPLTIDALDNKEDKKGKIVPFTIDQQGGWLILSIMVDGKGPLKIVYDTGASESYINPTSYRKYSLSNGKHKLSSI